MDFQKTFSQAFEIVKLKEPAMHTVAKDPHALQPALIITVLGSAIGGLGTYLFPRGMGFVTYRSDLPGVVIAIVLAALVAIAGLFLTGFLAERVFHSKLDMHGYVKVMGFANILALLTFYPPLAIVSGIWTFVVFCVVLSKLGKLGVGSIILLILLEILIFGVFGSLLGGMMGVSGGYPGMMGY